MSCNDNAITIVRGNDTDWNGANFLTINLNTEILDLSTMKAEFTLGNIVKTFDDISGGSIVLNLTAQETANLPPFLNGVLKLIDTDKRIATIESLIPFKVISVVHGNAIATEPYTLNFDVKQEGETILTVNVESAVTVEVGTTTTLPAGSNATVENVGTGNHLVLNFGIPKGEDGQGAVQSVNGKVGDVVITINDLTTSTQQSALNSGANTTNIGQIATNKNDISTINGKIPTQASEENQLADKNFVNSSISTNTANFIGTFNSVADLEAYSGTLTNNDYAFVVGTDSAGNTVYDRYKYNAETQEWLFEYELNNSSFTSDQWAAINSGITSNGVTLIGTALQPNDNITELNNNAGYITSADVLVDDVQINGTSIVSNKVANIAPVELNGTYGVVKLGDGKGGLAINSAGNLYVVGASQGQVAAKLANINLPVMPGQIDTAVKAGMTTNTLTLTDAEKTAACGWIGALENVQINGTDLTKDVNNKVNIPAAANGGAYGVVKLAPAGSNFGLGVHSSGSMYVVGATDAQITNKTGINNALLPGSIDLIVKTGMTTNALTWSSTEKTNARDLIGAVGDVQINNTSIVSNGTATIPLAAFSDSTPIYGLVRLYNYDYGLSVNASTGGLHVLGAADSQITGKTNTNRPITPNKLDLAVKTGVTTNTNSLSDSEKTSACSWLGAAKQTEVESLNSLIASTVPLTDFRLDQLKQLSHTTFDLSKFTVVGTPTITADGIASGFSDSNYINTSPSFSQTSAWKISTEFYAKPDGTEQLVTYFSDNLYFNYLLLNASNKLVITPKTDNISRIIPTNFVLTEGYYKVEFGWDKTKYYINVFDKNGSLLDTANQADTDASTYPIQISYIGKAMWASSKYFKGTIDLKQFSITVDGVPVFSGNKTGIFIAKDDDYTVIGTPTISADGIASGFNSSNRLSFTFDATNADKYTIEGCFTYKNTGAPQDILQFGFYVWQINEDGNIQWWCPNDNNTFYVVQGTVNASTVGLSDGDKVWLRTEYIGSTTRTMSYSLDGINYVTLPSGTANNRNTFWLNTVYLGAAGSGNAPYGGTIDLNTLKVYVDGSLVYQPCLKIPYTEANTGSRIVDSIYRGRVNDMALQFGYANFYTLSDTDFTLPQVEEYGLIGQQTLRKSTVSGINRQFLYSDRTQILTGSCTSGVEVTLPKAFSNSNYALSVPYSAKSTTAFTPTQTGDWFAIGEGVL